MCIETIKDAGEWRKDLFIIVYQKQTATFGLKSQLVESSFFNEKKMLQSSSPLILKAHCPAWDVFFRKDVAEGLARTVK